MRFDFVFSYWLFVWFLIHLFVHGPSPKGWLWLGIVYEVGLLVVYFIYQYPAPHVAIFVAVTILIKVIPLWILRHERFRLADAGVGGILLVLYLGWLTFNGTSIVEVAQTSLQQIKGGVPSSPMTQLVFRHGIPMRPQNPVQRGGDLF